MLIIRQDLPPAPPWITPELIRRTLDVWQKRSLTPLSEADAIGILIAVGRLADVMRAPPCDGPPPD